VIVLMAGLPGTGKSSIAAELEQRIPGQVLLLDKDRIRHAVFGLRHTDYSRDQDDFCAALMYQAAARHLKLHPDAVVILDGRSCSRRYQVQQVQQLAARTGRPLRILECACPSAIARIRITRDATAGTHPAANRDLALYLRLRDHCEPITAPALRLRTDAPLHACVEQAVQYLASAAPCPPATGPLAAGTPHHEETP
jgi:predicted kinase